MKMSKDILTFEDGDCYKIYNHHLHKLSRVHKKIIDFLRDAQSSDRLHEVHNALSEAQILNLIENGVLIEDEVLYLSNKYKAFRKERPKKLHSAYLHLTMNCNLSCEYCYTRENLNTGAKGLSTSEWLTVLSILHNADVKNVIFTGGETFMSEGLYEITKYAKHLGFGIELLTNATLMSGNSLDVLKYTDKVIVSLDGLQDTRRTGSEKYNIIQNIQEAHKKYPDKIIVRSVVARGFEAEVLKLKEYLGSIGISHVESLCIPTCKEEMHFCPDFDSYPFTEDQIGGNCGAANGVFAIDFFGDIFPCQALVKPELKICNIFDDDWLESFIESTMPNVVNSFVPYDSPDCEGCVALHFCDGGCRAIAYDVYKKFDQRSDFLCPFYRKTAMKKIEKM